MDLQPLRRSFDTLAPIYLGLEAVVAGGILQRCRTAFLTEAIAARRALVLGEGPGRFLVELLQSNPIVEVVCVEQSRRMIEVARRELARKGLDETRIAFVPMDALTWRPPKSEFDLIVTNFFLDCFRRDQLEQLIASISESATARACWLLADFRLPDRGWKRWRARAVLALMYRFFRFATRLSASQITPPDEFLEAGGFRLVARRFANCELLHSDLWRRSTA